MHHAHTTSPSRARKTAGGTLDELGSRFLTDRLRSQSADPAEADFDRASQAMHSRGDLEDKAALFAALGENQR